METIDDLLSENKKYELTTIKRRYFDGSYSSTLFHIRSLVDIESINVKKGDLGGCVENQHNLSQTGDCWVDINSNVSGNAKVSGNCIIRSCNVSGNAKVSGNSELFLSDIKDDAEVYGFSKINLSTVYGHAVIKDNAYLSGNIYVRENVKICDQTTIIGDVTLSGNIELYKNSVLIGNGIILSGKSKLYNYECESTHIEHFHSTLYNLMSYCCAVLLFPLTIILYLLYYVELGYKLLKIYIGDIKPMRSVKKDGLTIKNFENVSEKVQLVAVKQNILSLLYIKNVYISVEEYILENNIKNVKYIDCVDVHNQYKLIKQNVFNIKYIKKPSDEIILESVKLNGKIFENVYRYIDYNPFLIELFRIAYNQNKSNVSFLSDEDLQWFKSKLNIID